MVKKSVAAVVCLVVLVTVASAAKPKVTPIFKDATVSVQGMEQISFMALNGEDRVFEYKLPYANVKGQTVPVFSVEDPAVIRGFPMESDLPAYLPKDKVLAVITIGSKLTAKELGQLSSTHLTDTEHIAAIQTAIWITAANMSQKYKLVESSIRNQAVLTAAHRLMNEADRFLTRKPQGVAVEEVIWPSPKLTVNSSRSKGKVESQFNYYGPYSIESANTSLDVMFPSGQNYAIVDSVGGSPVQALKVNQSFYVRVGVNMINSALITFTASAVSPDIRQFGDYVLCIKEKTTISCNLSIGNKDNMGNIVFIKYDSTTDVGVPGVVVEIRDAKGVLVASMTTDRTGVATSPELRVGTYAVAETMPANGYEEDKTRYQATIMGNGEVVQIVSQAKSVVGFVTFVCQDTSTAAPVGGSIFEVIDASNNLAAKIGINQNGKCSNIKLPPGEYRLREVQTNPLYECVVQYISFEVTAGEAMEVFIPKTLATSYTKLVITDAAGTPQSGIVQLMLANGTLFGEFAVGDDGELKIGLPSGDYFVKTKAKLGFAPSETQPFQVLATTDDTVVNIRINNYDALVEGRVRDSQGKPVPRVALVAVDDQGQEYSAAISGDNGEYRLEALPDRAVIFIRVFRAPSGFSGVLRDNRTLTVSKNNNKDLVLLSTIEYYATVGNQDQSLGFYEPKIVFDGYEQEPPTSAVVVEPPPGEAMVESPLDNDVSSDDSGETWIEIAVVAGFVLAAVIVLLAIMHMPGRGRALGLTQEMGGDGNRPKPRRKRSTDSSKDAGVP